MLSKPVPLRPDWLCPELLLRPNPHEQAAGPDPNPPPKSSVINGICSGTGFFLFALFSLVMTYDPKGSIGARITVTDCEVPRYRKTDEELVEQWSAASGLVSIKSKIELNRLVNSKNSEGPVSSHPEN